MSAAKDMQLVPVEQVRVEPVGLVQMIERMASDSTVDVDKFERFLAMHERLKAQDAKAQYFSAFADLQGDIPEIKETGKIDAGNAGKRKYATNEDIQKVCRPILQRHGFALTFRTEFPAGAVKITGILAHRGGHSEQTEFVSAIDTGAGRNAIQSLGSTVSYGIRYTTRALLNITSGEADDDGQSVGTPEPPSGYAEWLHDLTSTADNGYAALEAAWKTSKQAYRDYRTRYEPAKHDALKVKAKAVKA